MKCRHICADHRLAEVVAFVNVKVIQISFSRATLNKVWN